MNEVHIGAIIAQKSLNLLEKHNFEFDKGIFSKKLKRYVINHSFIIKTFDNYTKFYLRIEDKNFYILKYSDDLKIVNIYDRKN